MPELLHTVLTGAYTVFMVLFLFGATVFVHEFGHFLLARRLGLVVQTFSIGFGPAIWSWEKDGIVYKIGWIPFGGYVALPQLDPEGMEKLQGAEEGEGYPEVSSWKKIVVALFGPIGNILLALLLAFAIFFTPGSGEERIAPVLGLIETNSAAYAAGLRAGDRIASVSGASVDNWYDFSVEMLLKQRDGQVKLTVLSGETEKQITVPVQKKPDEYGEMISGVSPAIPCVFGPVTAEGPADRAGVKKGDKALEFNGVMLVGWTHFTDLVQKLTGENILLAVEREGETLELLVTPEYNEEHDRMMIGVQLGVGSGMPWMQYKRPFDQLKYDALAIFRVLKALVTPGESGQAASGLGGPVAIFVMLAGSIKMGVLNALGFIRFININLAILNLLPIPVLDGGHIVFALWEGITRRKVHAKVQAVLVNIFATLLIVAMLLLSVKDVDRTFKVKEFFGKLFSAQTGQVEEE